MNLNYHNRKSNSATGQHEPVSPSSSISESLMLNVAQRGHAKKLKPTKNRILTLPS